MSNDDLVAFLRARLDEDEQTAREAQERDTGRWFVGDKWNVYDERDETPHEDGEANPLVAYGNAKPLSEHIARHDPARVLAEVDAKRRILDECERTLAYEDHGHWLADQMLRLLALPYAGNPDYQPEWAPPA